MFNPLIKMKKKLKSIWNKMDTNKKHLIKNLLFHAIVPGILINYSLWAIFGLKFNYYTFPAYGIFLYLIKSEFMGVWWNLFFKIAPRSE